MEREKISLAHVWPKPYPGQTESTAKTTCYWFVGLVVGNTAGVHLDLTSPIKTFTDIVMRSAIQINVWKTGMKIEAYYRNGYTNLILLCPIRYNFDLKYSSLLIKKALRLVFFQISYEEVYSHLINEYINF